MSPTPNTVLSKIYKRLESLDRLDQLEGILVHISSSLERSTAEVATQTSFEKFESFDVQDMGTQTDTELFVELHSCQDAETQTSEVLSACSDFVPSLGSQMASVDVRWQKAAKDMGSLKVNDNSVCGNSGQGTNSWSRNREWQVVGQGKDRRGSRPRVSIQSKVQPIPTANRFETLASKESNEPLEQEVHVIGDSLVRGLNVNNGKVKGKAVTWCYPGARVEHVKERVNPILRKSVRDPVVVVHVGTNNVGRDVPKVVGDKMRHLIREIRLVRPASRILVCDILPRFPVGQVNRERLDLRVPDISRQLSWVCLSENVQLVSAVWPLLKRPDLYYRKDGVHLNVRGKRVLSEAVSSAITKGN